MAFKLTPFKQKPLLDEPNAGRQSIDRKAWSYKHQAIKICKTLLAKCKTQEARDQMEFVIKVLSESHYQGLGKDRENSLTKELIYRGATVDVQDYILKNMMGSMNGVQLEEIDQLQKPATERGKNKKFEEFRKSAKVEQKDDLKSKIWRDAFKKTGQDNKDQQSSNTTATVPKIITPAWPGIENQQQLDVLLQQSNSWLDFDIFEVARLTSNRPLVVVGTHILKQHGLLDLCNVDENTLINFFNIIEEAYPVSNPFHCSIHGTDVMQTMNSLLVQSDIISKFQPHQLFTCLIAAAIHDVDHPGLSNNFLIQTGSPIAVTYNDKSVLENHHLATFFRIVRRPECNIFKNWTTQQRRDARRVIVDMVLATDMAMHVQLVDDFNSLTETTNKNVLSSTESTKLFMNLLIHISDVSNPAKRFEICHKWADRVMEEFYFQGDLEDSLGLPVSRECDRQRSSKESVQIGFIDFVVRPLIEVWVKLYPQMIPVLKQMEHNSELWKKQRS